MKKTLFLLLWAAITFSFLPAHAYTTERLLLDGWTFQPGSTTNEQYPVTIPHDWAIAGPFDREIDKQVVAIEQNGETEATEKTGRSGSLPWIGEGTYRRTITIPEGYAHAELIFDGAMSEPRVFIDDQEVGYWAYGYNTFRIDITNALPRDRSAMGYILPGQHNLTVHLQNIEESSRWYPGAGLYRPVRLVLSGSVAVDTWGIFARTTRLDGINASATNAEKALLTVTTTVRKDLPMESWKLRVHHYLTDASGAVVSEAEQTLPESLETTLVLQVNEAALWSPEHPTLYTLVTELVEQDEHHTRVLDRQLTKTGIRLAEFTQDGFLLNGEKRKFRGVCLHHDLGSLGAAFNKAAFRRQVALLKEIGCDAIRTSHNMPAPWQMDICDEEGMLVMAESCDMWVYPKCKNGYSRFFEQWWERDFTNLILVHRNHPSIVMWSIGNEIPEQGSAAGLHYTRQIQDLIHRLDPTRPCTQGCDRGEGAIWSGVLSASDVPGFNYRTHLYRKGRAASPKGVLLGTETCSTVSSRGVYKFPVTECYGTAYEDGQVSSYDMECCIWSNLPDDDWMWQDKADWVMGEFVWTGFDYLGEPTPYDEYWPSRSSYFGIYDLAGLPKDRAFLYRTHWAPEQETLHLLPHWTWKGREGELTPVFCYTSYPEAELFINGRSQGRRRHIDLSLEDYDADRIDVPTPWGDMTKFANPNAPEDKNRLNRYRLRWMDTRYEPGELRVVAYDADGNVAAEQLVRTAGKPHHIELSIDRPALHATPTYDDGSAADCPDMAFVTVRIVDKDGNLCPDAANQLSFAVKGTGIRYNSACNGDATSLESFTGKTMRAFHGELVVVLEATKTAGTSTLTVTAKGLKGAKCQVLTK